MPDYKENIGQAVDLEYLQSKIESIGAENAVPHMTSKQFDLLITSDHWADYAKYLNDEQIASLTAKNLESMGEKVSDIPDINKISIEGGADSLFLSITDHKQLSDTQLQSLDASHIQQLIDNNKMIALKENVQYLDPDALAEAASNANGITPKDCSKQLQLEYLTQDQLETLIAQDDRLNAIDGELQAQYVKNEGEATKTATDALTDASTEAAADAATISSGTIIACVVAAIIVLALMFKIFREK